MTADVTAALKVAEKLMTIGRAPRLSFDEKLLAGAVLRAAAELASSAPATPRAKEIAWDRIQDTLEIYLENVSGGQS